MNQSQYSRRERGISEISKSEWEKLAEVLNTAIEDIYEDEDKNIVVNNDNNSGNFSNYAGNNNFYYNADKEVITTLLNYIKKLESEINELKN